MSTARFWQDEDAVDEVSNTIRQLVDDTAKAAVEDFITGEELCISFSASNTTVYVSSIGDHEQVFSKGEPLLDLLNDVIKSIDELDDPVDSPYPAMREAYLKWQERIQAEKAEAE